MIVGNNSQRGSTLIEVIIYSGIVAGFLAIAFLAASQFVNFSDDLRYQKELGENQRFIVQKLNWLLSGVQNINIPMLGDSGAMLSMDKINSISNPLVLDLSGGKLRLTIGGGQSVELNNDYGDVSGLLFEHLDFSGQSAIRITATLSNDLAATAIDTTIIYQ
ncbi:MAG: hypothetical protein Q8O87_01945 [bacterium]|nr:hypothetical protein [bacterium]